MKELIALTKISHLSWGNVGIINSHKECWDSMTPPKLSGDTPVPTEHKKLVLRQVSLGKHKTFLITALLLNDQFYCENIRIPSSREKN